MISEDKINRFVDVFNRVNNNHTLATFLSEILEDIEETIQYQSQLELDLFGRDSHYRSTIQLLAEGEKILKNSKRWIKQMRYYAN